MGKLWGLGWWDLVTHPTSQPLSDAIPAELTATTINQYAAKGIRLFRIGFKWDVMQPTLYGALNTTYLERVLYGCRSAAQNNAKVILDLHSIDTQRSGQYIGSSGLPYTSLTDFWQRMTQAVKNDATAWQGVYGMEIMNEPGQTNGTWLGNHTSTGSGYRAGIQGVRNVDTNIKVLVSGEGYTNCTSWYFTPNNNNMVLPDANCIVTGHAYFDGPPSAGSPHPGNYRASGSDINVQPNPTDPSYYGMTPSGATSLFDYWLNFLSIKGYRGMVTEFGVPCRNGTGTEWLAILSAVMTTLNNHPNVVGGTTWVGGGYGNGMWDSWIYNGSQGIGPRDDPGYASGPSNAHWTVLGNYPTDLGDSEPPPDPPPAAGVTDMYVYREAFENTFAKTDQFNNAVGSTATPTPPYAGTSALSITYGGGYGGVVYTRTDVLPFSSANYDSIVLAIYNPTAGTRDISVAVIDSTGTGLYDSKIIRTIPAASWSVQTFNIQTLCANVAKSLLGLSINDQSGGAQPTYYVDDLRFRAFGSAATAAPFVTITTVANGIASVVTASPMVTIATGPVVASISGLPTALSIFSENYDNGFIENGSWGNASTAVATPQSPYEGTKALGVTHPAQYVGVVIRRATAFSSALYSVLTLTVYSTEVRYIGVSLIDSAGTGLWGSKYLPPPIPAATWTTINIPVPTLTGGAAVSLSGVAISDQSPAAGAHPQIYVDHFGFVANNATAAPVITITTNLPGTAVGNATAAPLVTITTVVAGAGAGFGTATALPIILITTAPTATTMASVTVAPQVTITTTPTSSSTAIFARTATPLLTITTAPTVSIDATPPVLSGIVPALQSPYSVAIVWTTNEPSDSQVEYGLTAAYGTLTPLQPALVVTHIVTIGGLTPGTTYHFRVRSRDASGNLAVS